MLAERGSGALVVVPVAHDQSLVAVRVYGSTSSTGSRGSLVLALVLAVVVGV